MSRYIDADLLKVIIDGGFDLDFDEMPETKKELLRMICDVPSADVVEIRHGHWIDVGADLDGAWYYRCSVCGSDAVDGYEYPLCPYCGARMDGESE